MNAAFFVGRSRELNQRISGERRFFALVAAANRFDVFVAELCDPALHRPGFTFTVRANRASANVVGNILERIDIFFGALAVANAFRDARHPNRTFATRRALPAGFVFVKRIQICERLNHFDGIVENDHPASPDG